LGVKSRTYYDPRGQVVRVVNPDGSEQRAIYGVPLDLADPERITPTPWDRYSYDANDNAGRTDPVAANGYRTHWNTPTSAVVDAWGRTVQTTRRNGAELLVSTQSLDVRGNVRAVVDPESRRAFEYAYDLANRTIHFDSIDAGTRTTVYDAAGQAIEQRDGKDALLLRTYDVAQRPRELWARDVTGEPIGMRERIEYGEGAVDATARNLLGRIVQQLDEAGVIEIDRYDFKGNLLGRTRQLLSDDLFTEAPLAPDVKAIRVDWSQAPPPALEARSYRFDFAYDALDRIVVSTLPLDVTGARRRIERRYNRASSLESVSFDGATYVAQIAYNAKGQRILIAHGNGVLTRYAYDPRTFRLARQRTERFVAEYQPAGVPLQDFVYSYDLIGNVLTMTDLVPGNGLPAQPNRLDRVFEYDPLYRLTHGSGRECAAQLDPTQPWRDAPRCQDVTATQAYDQYYGYDAVGNLRSIRHQNSSGGFTRTLNPHVDSNRLDTLQVAGITYAYKYDGAGNMIAEGTSRTFEWDHSNRMRAFREGPTNAAPTVFAQYLYDSSGQRIKKIVRNSANQISVTAYFDGVFEHHRNSPNEENDNVHIFTDEHRVALCRIGSALSNDPFPSLSDGVMYHLSDHLESSNVVCDSSGGFLNREEYTPFGETSFGGFARKRFRFTGKEREEESGFTYHGARYCSLWLGRWTSTDPKGLVDGYNLYAYVRSNPIGRIDRTGQQSVSPSPALNQLGKGQDQPKQNAPPQLARPTAAEVNETVASFVGRDVVQNKLSDIKYLDDKSFDKAGLKVKKLVVWEEMKAQGPVLGFTDPVNEIAYVNIDKTKPVDAYHEGVHGAAGQKWTFKTVKEWEAKFPSAARFLDEGITEYYAREATKKAGVNYEGHYVPNYTVILALLNGGLPKSVLSEAYFKGNAEPLEQYLKDHYHGVTNFLRRVDEAVQADTANAYRRLDDWINPPKK
jgi:RHS repeat-associated protein